MYSLNICPSILFLHVRPYFLVHQFSLRKSLFEITWRMGYITEIVSFCEVGCNVIYMSMQCMLIISSRYLQYKWFNCIEHSRRIWYIVDIVPGVRHALFFNLQSVSHEVLMALIIAHSWLSLNQVRNSMSRFACPLMPCSQRFPQRFWHQDSSSPFSHCCCLHEAMIAHQASCVIILPCLSHRFTCLGQSVEH